MITKFQTAQVEKIRMQITSSKYEILRGILRKSFNSELPYLSPHWAALNCRKRKARWNNLHCKTFPGLPLSKNWVKINWCVHQSFLKTFCVWTHFSEQTQIYGNPVTNNSTQNQWSITTNKNVRTQSIWETSTPFSCLIFCSCECHWDLWRNHKDNFLHKKTNSKPNSKK